MSGRRMERYRVIEERVVTAIRALAGRVEPPARSAWPCQVRFTSREWEDGYFLDASAAEIHWSDGHLTDDHNLTDLDVLDEPGTLDGLLTAYTAGPIGRHYTLVVDLITDAVDLNDNGAYSPWPPNQSGTPPITPCTDGTDGTATRPVPY